jgi:CheY-like chemotaxis protein
MVSEMRSTELIRDALVRLYDPRALLGTPLAAELRRRGSLRSPDGLYMLLIEAIESLRPPESAPVQSHSWCCYRYLTGRYIDCRGHASISAELGLSVRQASRIHHEALIALEGVLFGDDPVASRGGVGNTASALPLGDTGHRPHLAASRPDASLKSELSLIASQHSDGPIAVAEVVASVFETIGPLAEARHLVLRSVIPDFLPAVRINRVALRQMLLNAAVYLMGPAIDDVYPIAAPTLSVTASSTNQDGTVTIDLERTGHQAARRDDESQPDSRDALLAAVHQLSRQQRCNVVRLPPTGDRVTVRLTVPTSDSVQTILVLDDNPDVGDLLQRMLIGSGYQPIYVRTANRAIKVARDVLPSVILLDVVLPIQDGWEVLAILRADPLTAHIPIVVCSVLPDRELALSLGAADFLAKPISRTSLTQALSRLQSSSVVGESVAPSH